MQSLIGLVVTGGGARGAYQAGVLKRIGEIKRVQTQGNPFPIIAGASAGAINGCAMAAGSDEFTEASKVTAQIWADLKPSDVFRIDLLSQTRNSLAFILDLSFGGFLRGGRAQSLLDAAPLAHFLRKHLRCERIQQNIRRGHLYALAISATNYNSGKSYAFVQGKKGHPLWNRSRRVALPTKIAVEHILASAAIPFVFRPVQLETAAGTAFFGDGCLRLQQPLSPAIRLGAEKLLAIGVRCESREHQIEPTNGGAPSLAELLGLLFNIIFLDHLATDIEHLERLNKIIECGQVNRVKDNGGCEMMRSLEVLAITPSVDLSKVAQEHERDMPILIQYFVSGLGRDPASFADLMSYLLFTSNYTRALIEIGYKDATDRIDEIEDFLYSPSQSGRGSRARTDATGRRGEAA